MKRNSARSSAGQIIPLLLIIAAFALGSNLSRLFPQEPTKPAVGAPPTLEPPTATVLPSNTPVPSATPTLDLSIQIPGLISGETNTPAATGGCTPRKDWKLTYTVQHGDALARIAELYGTTVDALVKGNCLSNGNVIVTGQVLKVPGTVQPSAVKCIPFDVLTPFNGTTNVAGGGSITCCRGNCSGGSGNMQSWCCHQRSGRQSSGIRFASHGAPRSVARGGLRSVQTRYSGQYRCRSWQRISGRQGKIDI